MTITITRPEDRGDRENLFRFLYNIWIRECGRELPGTDHARAQIQDPMDDWANHFIAVDSQGQIAGCVRVNTLSKGHPESDLSAAMGFETLAGLFGADRVSFISHLAISPAYRGGTVISLIMSALFTHLFESRTSVAACYCRLGLVTLYHRIGMRPYLPNFNWNSRNQVPLIGCINDYDYLERIQSPLHMLLPPDCNDQGQAANKLSGAFPLFTAPEFTTTSSRNLWAQLAHASPARDTDSPGALFQGLSQEVLDTILPRLPRITLAPNETVQPNQTRDSAMGLLVSGALGLGVGSETDPHFIYVIGPGESFGELVTLARVRSSSVIIALEESEVLLIPEHLFDRLGKKDPETALRIYKNLIALLARRTAAANASLAGHLCRQGPSGNRIRRPARHTAASLQAVSGRTESYHFDTLSDKGGELERLTRQAKIAEALEFKVLRDIGLTSGDRILDLGSGPGITSMLLARQFPDSRITGVEPEPRLRHIAQAAAEKKKMDRCTFLDGTAESIPLSDGCVDFSYARLLFQHIPDPIAALGEMRRVTRSGGIVCIMDVDDGTIFIHPRVLEWEGVDARVARAQAGFGGDRHVGRKLLGYFTQAGLTQVQVDVVPVTTQMLGPDTFYEIVFGFKSQHLKRAGDWDDGARQAFSRIRETLNRPGAFASENIFVAHGLVP